MTPDKYELCFSVINAVGSVATAIGVYVAIKQGSAARGEANELAREKAQERLVQDHAEHIETAISSNNLELLALAVSSAKNSGLTRFRILKILSRCFERRGAGPEGGRIDPTNADSTALDCLVKMEALPIQNADKKS